MAFTCQKDTSVMLCVSDMPIPDVPSKYACDKSFNVDHAMICPKGGFPTLRHNEIRDITADLL